MPHNRKRLIPDTLQEKSMELDGSEENRGQRGFGRQKFKPILKLWWLSFGDFENNDRVY